MGQQLGVDVQLAHAAGDELRELGAEVEDRDDARLRDDGGDRRVAGGAVGGGGVERDLEVGLDLGVVGGQDPVAGVGRLAVDRLAPLASASLVAAAGRRLGLPAFPSGSANGPPCAVVACARKFTGRHAADRGGRRERCPRLGGHLPLSPGIASSTVRGSAGGRDGGTYVAQLGRTLARRGAALVIAGSMALAPGTTLAAPVELAAGSTVSATILDPVELNPKPAGYTTDLRAHVTPNSASGTVSFYDDDGVTRTLLGSGALGPDPFILGELTASYTIPADQAAGIYHLVAVYEGDDTFAGSESAPLETFTVGPRPSVPHLTVYGPHDGSGATAQQGDVETVTVDVTDGGSLYQNPLPLEGSVALRVDGVLKGTQPVRNLFELPTAGLSLGAHTIRAEFTSSNTVFADSCGGGRDHDRVEPGRGGRPGAEPGDLLPLPGQVRRHDGAPRGSLRAGLGLGADLQRGQREARPHAQRRDRDGLVARGLERAQHVGQPRRRRPVHRAPDRPRRAGQDEGPARACPSPSPSSGSTPTP